MHKRATEDQTLHNGCASLWSRAALAAVGTQTGAYTPLITADDVRPLIAGQDLWDFWPVQNDDGAVAFVNGGTLWMALSAPRGDNPADRHAIARIRLLHRRGNDWRDCGYVLPEGANPGSREWSGSARIDGRDGRLYLYYTATGRHGEAPQSYEQRLFQANARLVLSGPYPTLTDWHGPELAVNNRGDHYASPAGSWGKPGHIKGFRDPYWFRDPADGQAYLLFTGSLPGPLTDYDGVIGLAAARADGGPSDFDLLPPLISGEGVANELERPHIIVHGSAYYLFWSTQASVFDPAGPGGPSGLYGMTAHRIGGPWHPLNGSGLVIANPPEEPQQAYSWQVLDTLDVVCFIDHWGLNGRDPLADPAVNRAQFGGTIAPLLKLAIDGDRVTLVPRGNADG